jgi:hypothetical protein
MNSTKNAQKYIDKCYSEEERGGIEQLDLENQNLEGDLDLTDFLNLSNVYIDGNPKLGKVIVSEGQKNTILIITTNAQQYLDYNYPPEKRSSVTKLDVCRQQLKGSLTLKEFNKLKEFWCSLNQLSSLEIINCSSLREVCCSTNQLTELRIKGCFELKILDASKNFLTNLDLSQNKELKGLDISDNNFSEQDLSFLSHLVNLKWRLKLGNWDEGNYKRDIYNRFCGSLSFLRNMNKLQRIDIHNTNVDSGLEYLPDSIAIIDWSFSFVAEDAKCQNIYDELFAKGKLKGWEERGSGREIKGLRKRLNEIKDEAEAYARDILTNELKEQEEKNCQLKEELDQANEKNAQLKEEVETHLKALGVSEYWHKRQKQELLDKIKKLEKKLEREDERGQIKIETFSKIQLNKN